MAQLISRKQLDDTLAIIGDVLLGSDDAELDVLYGVNGYHRSGDLSKLIRRIRQMQGD